MDFAIAYTEEQERFRREVRTWVEQNIPEDMREPIDPRDFSKEQYLFWRQKHRELGQKGWLYPTYPKEYGGGGLTGDQESILEEEFSRAGVPRSFSNPFIFPALLVWGTEEQKEKFLKPLVLGEQIAWQKFTEPHSGADLASYESRAVRDGDDWVLSGSSVFVSGKPRPQWNVDGPNYLFGPMLTDPDSPRHRNLGFFLVPVPSTGLEIREQNLLNGHDQHFIYMDGVRVPGDHLIGGDHQGWQVAMTSLEQEHGGRGQAFPRDEMVENIVAYAREGSRTRSALSGDPVRRQVALDAALDAQVATLFAKRTYWMYQSRMSIQHEGIEANVHFRQYKLQNMTRAREVMGPYALVDRLDPRAPFSGQPEVYQRTAQVQSHGAGGLLIAKVIAARRIGISRTQERAAPTPATATAQGG